MNRGQLIDDAFNLARYWSARICRSRVLSMNTGAQTLPCSFCVAQGQICRRDSGSEFHPFPPKWDWIRSVGGSSEKPSVLRPHAWTHWGLRTHAGMCSSQFRFHLPYIWLSPTSLLNASCFPPSDIKVYPPPPQTYLRRQAEILYDYFSNYTDNFAVPLEQSSQ